MPWFRLGGRARYLFRTRDVHDLQRFTRRAADAGISFRVLGAGANVLIGDAGYDGAVIRLDQPGFRLITQIRGSISSRPEVSRQSESASPATQDRFDGNTVTASRSHASTNPDGTNGAGQRGKAVTTGMATASNIPGARSAETITQLYGAAGEHRTDRVEGTTLQDDVLLELGAGTDLMPLTRQVSQKGLSGMEGLAGIPATIGGAVTMNAGGRYGSMSDVVRAATVMTRTGALETWTAEELRFGYRTSAIGEEIVVSATVGLRQGNPQEVLPYYESCFAAKERGQPLKQKSAGCIFKNPTDEPAGALIDRLGLKESRYGGAMVSPVHANFIVTDSDATATDVIRLIDFVRARVAEETGTWLETEVDIW